jgi:RNA polymerase sigma factor (sigma-70 family)
VQAELTGTPAADETSDAVLLLHTREGDGEAYGSLYLRHVAAARVLARQLARDPSEADELVAESFTRVLGMLHRGGGPEAAFRPYLLSTMRRLHVDRRVAERKTEPTDDLTAHDPGTPFVDRPADELERSIVSTAFASLPERWRLVLWHTEVEGLQPAQVAPLLGITANATAALAVRARAGLRDAYLSAHVNDATDPKCREVGPSLGGYVRGTLSRRERVAVDAHLDSCARCSAAVLELSDTAATMRGVIGPLILGAAVLSYREGLLALGPHAIPSAALLHSAGVAAVHGAAAGAGATGAAGAAGSAAGRPTWQLVGAAGLAGVVVIGAALAFALTAGTPSRTAAGNPGSSATAPQPSATSGSVAAPTPSSSSSGATPSSSATTGSAAQQVGATTSTTPPPPSVLPPLLPPASSNVSLSAVADLVPDNFGYLRLGSDNPNGVPVTETAVVQLPTGVEYTTNSPAVLRAGTASNASFVPELSAAELAAAQPTAGQCVVANSQLVCSLGLVAAHGTASMAIPVHLSPSTTGGRWVVTVTSRSGTRTATVTRPGSLGVSPTGIPATWFGQGHYQVSAGGAGLLSCQDDVTPVKGCSDWENPTDAERTSTDPNVLAALDNNAHAMLAINDAGSGWTDSSSATVSIPKGSTVVKAFLQWSASGFADSSGLSHSAYLQGPGGPKTKTKVDATSWQAVTLSGGDGYTATADVTAQVAAGGGGTWTGGDLALVSGSTGVYAGWSLTVITSTPTAVVKDVTVLQGPWLLSDSQSTWTGQPPGLEGHSAVLTLVAWEGDAGLTGDQLDVNGSLTPIDGGPAVDGATPQADNIAESFAIGAKRTNTFGTDVRQLSASAKQGATLSITTAGDSWILGLMVVSTGNDTPGL